MFILNVKILIISNIRESLVLSGFFSPTQIPFKQITNNSEYIFYHFLLKISDSITAKL